MCLGVPGKVLELSEDIATVELGRANVRVSMQLLDGVTVGDYVIVHAGFAIERLDTDVAQKTLESMISVGDHS